MRDSDGLICQDLDNIDNNVGEMVIVTGAREGELLENIPTRNKILYCKLQMQIVSGQHKCKTGALVW